GAGVGDGVGPGGRAERRLIAVADIETRHVASPPACIRRLRTSRGPSPDPPAERAGLSGENLKGVLTDTMNQTQPDRRYGRRELGAKALRLQRNFDRARRR